MNLLKLFVLIALVAMLASACSGDKASQDQTQQSSAAQPAQPQASTAPAPASTDPMQLPKNGKVVKAMHAGGYTYMQVENGGKEFWIAATMMSVKRDDYVRWADAAVMKNFKSSTLHKTFDEILFVTNAELDQ